MYKTERLNQKVWKTLHNNRIIAKSTLFSLRLRCEWIATWQHEIKYKFVISRPVCGACVCVEFRVSSQENPARFGGYIYIYFDLPDRILGGDPLPVRVVSAIRPQRGVVQSLAGHLAATPDDSLHSRTRNNLVRPHARPPAGWANF